MFRAGTLTVSSVTVLETRIVFLSRHGHEAVLEFNDMLQNAGVVVVPFDAELSSAAFDAFHAMEKGEAIPRN